MIALEANIMGVLKPSTQRQLISPQGIVKAKRRFSESPLPKVQASTPPTRAPAIIGPSTSPMLPIERCIEMKNPRRWGKRRASKPRAGGCHKALPIDPRARAARISR